MRVMQSRSTIVGRHEAGRRAGAVLPCTAWRAKPLAARHWLARAACVLALAAVAWPPFAGAQAPSSAAAQRPRNVAITEQRVALVIGNASYKFDPLDNPVNDARLVAKSLREAKFQVLLYENLGRAGMVQALREFGDKLNDQTIAVLYYAGHGVQLRDRNYLIPVDAQIRSEDEIPISGMDVSFFLNRMADARSRINIVILDACRNNPFAGRGGPAARGLAQMDAPVGTLLAFATAPGKLAPDNVGPPGNSLYTSQLAKHLMTPGLPVELMFKRVREAVVQSTDALQVPWESSSLQGEFAFVPGPTNLAGGNAEQEAAGEIAFWNSIQNSTRGEEYRAYLRQYPNGRFVSLAQARVAAFTPTPAAAPAVTAPQPAPGPSTVVPPVASSGGASAQAGASAPAPATTGAAPATTAAVPAGAVVASAAVSSLPRAGDTWRYRIKDQFRLGDLFLTATVDEVTPAGVAETWTTTSDDKLRTTLVPLRPGFNTLPGWLLTPPEFSPYLQASGLLGPGQKIADQQRKLDKGTVALRVSIDGEEDVVVPAGRFRTQRVTLRAPAPRGARGVTAEHVVWYAPAVKRMVRYSVSTRVGNSQQEDTLFELMEYRLN
jgi:hypothetical protein